MLVKRQKVPVAAISTNPVSVFYRSIRTHTGKFPRNEEEVQRNHQATSCKPFARAASTPPDAAAGAELQQEAAWRAWSRARRPPPFRGSTGAGAGAAVDRGAERERKRPAAAGLGETMGRGTRRSGSADAIAMEEGEEELWVLGIVLGF